uniref:C2H2-type domain-containing protein n=1 Tax=Knipowitschia caucasica TaxID=637954 RepID=A0AAV2LND6_KNICA
MFWVKLPKSQKEQIPEAFLDGLSLKSHRLLHTGRKLHPCEYCGKLFQSPAKVLRHYNVHMKDKASKQVQTVTLSEDDKTTFLNINVKEETGSTPISSYTSDDQQGAAFTCETCGEASSTLANLQIHQRLHTGKKIHSCRFCGKPNVCQNCGKTYKSKTALKRHQQQEALKAKTAAIVKKEEEPDLTCHKCGKEFTDNKKLRIHDRIHRKPNICKYCGRVFLKPSHLIRHERVHTGEKPFQCQECGKSFHLSYLLKSHQNSHSGERPYVCEVCGKGFSSAQTRSSHKKYVHAKPEERSVCTICGKVYRSDSGLRTHMLRHTSDIITGTEINPTADKDVAEDAALKPAPKIFACIKCGKTFSAFLKLRLHLRVHTGRRVHPCRDCPRVFLSPSLLKQHAMTHSDHMHTCEHCGKSFKNIRVYQDHRNLHTKELMRPCETCNRVFWTRNSYVCHVKRCPQPRSKKQTGQGHPHCSA